MAIKECKGSKRLNCSDGEQSKKQVFSTLDRVQSESYSGRNCLCWIRIRLETEKERAVKPHRPKVTEIKACVGQRTTLKRPNVALLKRKCKSGWIMHLELNFGG
ncbi:hypothetical protein PHSY_000031 [Pseudozyma hubeiensis SY62]|uniref:Uncharacterized protein n=1 Tax=Pseudozyma hubeiensis (strain SY62) TaxID=1305764 RepID=R9NVJ2_PSEHS|nr:hypothetical protein PHSY_000031 [Pseudozyma hubeiensis SY62]GAC92478.1 hypothetical protein PHSY_000031 [Pseudozyma hubeiensis SY62]